MTWFVSIVYKRLALCLAMGSKADGVYRAGMKDRSKSVIVYERVGNSLSMAIPSTSTPTDLIRVDSFLQIENDIGTATWTPHETSATSSFRQATATSNSGRVELEHRSETCVVSELTTLPEILRYLVYHFPPSIIPLENILRRIPARANSEHGKQRHRKSHSSSPVEAEF